MEKKTVCVTGAGGFIASWIVLKLLQRGYNVHGTVRDPDDDKKNGHLRKLEGAKERLTLFKADVLDYDSLSPAIRGCDGVFHTACPVAAKFENPNDVLDPANKGTENVFKVCHQEKIKRVVFTSSGAAMAAVPHLPEDYILDENSWSDAKYCRENQHWYMLAKTESEKLAWELAKEYDIDLIVICPFYVLGPILQPSINASIQTVAKLINGSEDAYPNANVPIVDVRDIAEAHVVAFESPPASGRYLGAARSESYKNMLETLKKHIPHLRYATRCADETADAKPTKFSNKKFVELIKELTPYERTLVDMATSLQEKGLISS